MIMRRTPQLCEKLLEVGRLVRPCFPKVGALVMLERAEGFSGSPPLLWEGTREWDDVVHYPGGIDLADWTRVPGLLLSSNRQLTGEEVKVDIIHHELLWFERLINFCEIVSSSGSWSWEWTLRDVSEGW
jgi:hypothetical protein